MTQEEKQLLLKDLCTRLLYGVRCFIEDDYDVSRDGTLYEMDLDEKTCGFEDTGVGQGYWYTNVDNVKPYLRPMSNMTEEESDRACKIGQTKEFTRIANWAYWTSINEEFFDWLNAHHFDYRGLIEKGLALPAPDGMYNF